MANIFVYTEVADGKLASISLEILSKAAELGDAAAILLGSAPDDAVQTLGNYGAKTVYRCAEDRKSTRLNSSHYSRSRMPSSA